MPESSAKRLSGRLWPAVLFVSIVAFWEFAVRFWDVPSIIVPTPTAVAMALWNELSSKSFYWHLYVTMAEVIVGFTVGAAFGLALGFAIAQSKFVERMIYPYVVAFQSVPKVAIAPIIIIWFGYDMASKIVITAAITFFPVVANTIVGLRVAPTDQIELMVANTATRWQIFRIVRIPQALPYIFVGLEVAAVLSVIGAIVGEFVGSKAGLGFLILQRNFNFDMAGTFAILIVLSLCGIGLHAIATFARRKIVFWIDVAGDRPVGS